MIGALAAIRAKQKQCQIPLYLTLVGQSAFKNQPSVMGYAFNQLMKVVNGTNIKVVYKLYDNNAAFRFLLGCYVVNPELLKLLPNNLINIGLLASKDHPVRLAATQELARRQEEALKGSRPASEE